MPDWTYEGVVTRSSLALSLVGFAIAPVGSSAAVLRGSIEYSKSGGFAGIDESMKIDRDGRGKIDRKTFRLDRREGSQPRCGDPQRRPRAREAARRARNCCDFF